MSSEKTEKRAPLACDITVNDKSLGKYHGYLREVTVETARGESSTVTIAFSTRHLEPEQRSNRGSNLVRKGDNVVIAARFGPDERREEVIRGTVREIHQDRPGEPGVARVRFLVKSNPLELDRKQHPIHLGDGPRTNCERIDFSSKVEKGRSTIVAEGVLDGVVYGQVLLTHLPVVVDGVGSTYDGMYYVDEVTHCFTLASYRQTFVLSRNATG